MISITPTTSDTVNFIVIREDPKSDFGNVTLRVSRSATLDGGCVIDNQGVSDSDRTFTIYATLNEQEASIVYNIASLYTEAIMSCNQGLFIGVISEINMGKITFLVKERIA